MTLLAVIAAVLILLAFRVPVAFALLLPSLGYFLLTDVNQLFSVNPVAIIGLNSFPLLAVPLFIMMGNLASATRITDRLFDFAQAVLGPVRGGLGYVNVATSFGFSLMSGSAVADAAAMGRVMVSQMRQRGWQEGFAVGITAASGIIGGVMPPSVPAVLYAVAAGVSLGGLLIAGIGPAMVLILFLSLAVLWHSRSRPNLRQEGQPLSEIGKAGLRAAPAMVTPVLLLGGIFGGIFTPTEAAAVAVGYMLLLGLVQRTIRRAELADVFVSTVRTVGSILVIVSIASVFGRVITLERGPELLADGIQALTESPVVFLLLANVLMLVVGMLLEPASAILILVPVLYPVAEAYEIEPLHFGSVVVLNLMIGLLTPPVGLTLYVISSSAEIPVSRVIRGTAPLLIPLLIALAVVTYIPQVALFLPELFGFL